MSTKFNIRWPKVTAKTGGPLKDIEPGTLVRDLNYSDGGAYGYWNGVGTVWFYKDHIMTVHSEDGSLDNCIAVPNATIFIKVEIEE